ncbi:Kelch repeat-containing protein [Steroidobacter cummioxidans]|uniref:Kelch repeat-containing protein n=1 Tax=Steroidobacter cummioxidans TaxID=1803913 RepID=UPI000E31485F|nr:kelch repeat-containing protein [Steroidobacter cummioxidans]
MKVLLRWSLHILCAFALAACGGGSNSDNNSGGNGGISGGGNNGGTGSGGTDGSGNNGGGNSGSGNNGGNGSTGSGNNGSTGGGNGPVAPITISTASLTLSGFSNAQIPYQDVVVAENVTVTFQRERLTVGALPGQTLPTWLRVYTPSQPTSPASVRIGAGRGTDPGDYSTTLRFTTSNADGSNATSQDMTVSVHLDLGQFIATESFGLATGSSVAVTVNNGEPMTLGRRPNHSEPNPRRTDLGYVVLGQEYTVAVAAQPTGQTCTFENGSPTLTQIAPSGSPVVHRVTCNASLVPWTWVGGPQTPSALPSYGTRGTPSSTNTPGARASYAYAAGADGNLWLFGGRVAGESGTRNDLWRYDIASGEWTWVSGSNSVDLYGHYGVLNQAAPDNFPGSRDGALAWVDASGNFWLFGGIGRASAGVPGFLNDLWKYDVAAGQWIWTSGVDGSNNAASGTYGVTPSVNNIPGGRSSGSLVRDSQGDVWIFGGNGVGANSTMGAMNDLWRFSPASGVWSWMSGSNAPGQTSVFGSRGEPSSGNRPSARGNASIWADASGNIWVFGGVNLNDTRLNDLWRFDPSTGLWAWMHGEALNPPYVTGFGVYQPPGATTDNIPAGRFSAAAWTDAAGNFWLFGGFAQTPHLHTRDRVNDLWKYSPASNTWSWMSGSNVGQSPSVFGTQGMPSNTNVPSSRSAGAAWTDGSGQLWMFGGQTTPNSDGLMTDVWRVTAQ